MNARETLQALLDGKTIIGSSGHLWKLDEYDGLVHRKPEKKAWQESPMVFNGDCEVYEEYSLNFEQALRAMLDGKVVEVERFDFKPSFPHRFNHEHSCFEFYSTSDGKWWMTHISECEQSCKWKVVE